MTGAVVWLTGLPGSGKSTLAARIVRRLQESRRPVLALDGDEVRASLVPAPSYDEAGRDAFYRTLVNLACNAARQGQVAVVAATAHRRRWRALAREHAPQFIEVHVATPLAECRRRDPRGLYARPDTREVPGVGVPYEAPEHPAVVAPNGDDPAACERVLALLGVGGRRRSTRLTGWRRIAGAMWHAPDDPQIYGALELDATPVLAFIERARAAGTHVTPTHLVGRAVGHALAAVPELNVHLQGGRARPRPSVDVFFIAAVSGGHDLSGVKITNVPGKPAIEIAGELRGRSDALRQGKDRDFSRSKRLMDGMPAWLLRPALRATAFLTEDLGLDLPFLSLHPSPFGSAMVTSVGMFGIPQGFAPLAWMYDVPLLVLVGEIAPRPVVVDGRVEARATLPITATIDHRYVDGWHVSRLMNAFRAYLAAPQDFEPALDVDQPNVSASPSRSAKAR